MANRVLRLNPILPRVWQDPATLQIGIDPPVVVLSRVPDDLLILLHHLGSGISESGLAMYARLQGVSPERTDALLEELAPALGPVESNTPEPFVLDGPHDLVTPASAVLAELGHCVARADSCPSPHDPEAAGDVVVFGHFVPAPRSFHRWLRLDRPHTPVIFSDQTITVGPRIVPGHTRCLRCALATRGHSPRTAAALASQLCGRVAPSASPEAIRLATWHARELILGREDDTRIRIVRGRALTERTTPSDDRECGCLGLEGP